MSTITQSNTDRRRSTGLEKPDFRYESTDHALIIGAGLAGCATANVLAASGMRCTVFDAKSTIASATSSVPLAIYRPLPGGAQSLEQSYLLSGYERLLKDFEDSGTTPDVQGLMELLKQGQQMPANQHWQTVSSARARQLTGNAVTDAAMHLASAGAINPAKLCSRWITKPRITLKTGTHIQSITQKSGDWIASDRNGQTVGRGQLVILANAQAAKHFVAELPLIPAKGQISCFTGKEGNPHSPVICNRGYVIPTPAGVWAGATFHRGMENSALTPEDDVKNYHFCSQFFAVHAAPNRSWAGVRSTTQDRMPLIGPVPQIDHVQTAYADLHHGRANQHFPKALYQRGIFTFVGLGARGVVQALQGANCLADIVFGRNALDEKTRLAIHPARFFMKEKRRRPG